MESLFESLPQPAEEAPHACIECANFGGRDRDQTAFLFRIGKGYCNDDRWHPGGRFAVVQDIVRPKHCKCFNSAPVDIVEARRKALEHYHVI